MNPVFLSADFNGALGRKYSQGSGIVPHLLSRGQGFSQRGELEMALILAELLSHLPEHDRESYLRLPKKNQEELRKYILASERLPSSPW